VAGIFGIVSEENCICDALTGTFYLQNRAESYCGLAWKNKEGKLKISTHKGLVKENYPPEKIKSTNCEGSFAIGSVSGNREPVSELSDIGGMMLCYDGNLINYLEMKNNLLKKKASFSGHHNPDEIYDSVLISKLISKQSSFEKGIETLVEQMQGDFSLIALTLDGVYASRGWGRKPLILGKKDGSYAASSESVSFINTGFEIVRDVEPGETVLLNTDGIHTTQKLDLNPIKFGTFEWVYNAHPCSVIDGRSVELARNAIGVALARRYPVEADCVSPIPNSGRCHADGYAEESGIPHKGVFKKFDYCGRSFTPNTIEEQNIVADEKLIPVRELIEGKRIIIVDDSIVKGNQTRKQTKRLRELGAKEVHARIACPPLMASCGYGKAIKKDEDCIAKVMSIEEIRETRGLDSLCYATIEDLENAIGKLRNVLCTDCWGF